MKKIFVINPDYGVPSSLMHRECGLLSRSVSAGTEISMACLTETKVEINSPADALLATPEILRIARRAEAEGADAVTLHCFSDPGLSACREILKIPVLGAGESALRRAEKSLRKPGFLLADPGRLAEKEFMLSGKGYEMGKNAFLSAVDLHGKSVWDARGEALAQLIEKGAEMKEKGADGLVLGCTSFLGLAGPLSKALSLPVIDPGETAVSMAEALIGAG